MSKKIITAIIVTLPFTGALFGQSSNLQSEGRNSPVITSLSGVVSDSMCGPKHMMKNKTPAECTRECVKNGSDYALVVGNKVYVLKGDQTSIDKFAGKHVKVKGSVVDNVVTVESLVAQ